MPNHFLTVGLCGRDWSRLESLGKEDFDFEPLKDANLCERIDPLPDELQGVVATTEKCRYRHKVTGEFSKDCNSPMGEDLDQWERVPLTAAEVSALVRKHGPLTGMTGRSRIGEQSGARTAWRFTRWAATVRQF